MGAEPRSAANPLAFLAGGGEMGERIRSLDWAATPVGPIHEWPQSLRSTVSFLFASKMQAERSCF